jgi:hypothetical protein
MSGVESETSPEIAGITGFGTIMLLAVVFKELIIPHLQANIELYNDIMPFLNDMVSSVDPIQFYGYAVMTAAVCSLAAMVAKK